jgi:hypothetical protein
MAIWTKARWVAAALPAYEVTDEAMKGSFAGGGEILP